MCQDVDAGRFREAEINFLQARVRAQSHGDTKLVIDALMGASRPLQLEGRFGESIAPLEQALSLARASGAGRRVAAASASLGNAHLAAPSAMISHVIALGETLPNSSFATAVN